MHSTRHLSFALGSAALLGLTLGACFTGEQAEGLPCTASSHCGPKLECIDGYCGGVVICADGSSIAAVLACDGMPDCEDASDEDPEACGIEPVYDQCVAADEPFEFQLGPTGSGVTDPIGLLAGQFLGDGRTDLLIAQRGGTFVRIFDVIPGEPPEDYDLIGDNTESPYFTTGVQAVVAYDFEQDTDTDIVVLTEDSRLFGYFSDPESGTPVLAAGSPFEIPTQPKIVDLAMGKLGDDAWADMVAITQLGFVLTATGDAEAGLAGETPFQLALSTTKLDGTRWDAVQLHDMDDDGIDEMLVSGVDGEPRLWIFTRQPGMVLTEFWQVSATVPIPFSPTEFAIGELDGMPGSDIALLERTNGSLVVLRQMGPDSFMPSGLPVELGVDIDGLALIDFDCSGSNDLVFNVESPASVRVLFTAEMGLLDPASSVEIASAGRPQGSLVVLKFDPDNSWDVFHAVEKASDLEMDEFRGLLSMQPGMP
jgi:hypothetical protein